jgi:RimJ/RimL family protein N-acetyltransferase
VSIYLRAFEPDDYKKINAWRNQEEFYRLVGGPKRFVSSERDRKWVEEKIFGDEGEIYLAICLRETRESIGYLSLSAIDYRNSRAEWSGIVIGEPAYRGHGYASQAIYLMLEFAFDELGMERVSGMWLDDHKTSLFVGQMLGFRKEGVLRSYVYKGGRRHDMIVMSMLREEFRALKKRYTPSGRQAAEKGP